MNLLRRPKGRRAIIWLMEQAIRDSRIMTANKEYALAGKFFEHLVEPLLSEKNSLFYAIDFHKFLATALYVWFRTSDERAKCLMQGFERMMMTLDPGLLPEIVSGDSRPADFSDLVGQIVLLAELNLTKIGEDIGRICQIDGLSDWSLELSMTSLYWLLAYWGEEFDALEVYCDNSKPINAHAELFEGFVGRHDKAYVRLGKRLMPSMVYNLAGPIKMVDSKSSAGVQIADVIASSVAYALRNPDDDISSQLIDLAQYSVVNQIVPDFGLLDLSQERTFVNATVLIELIERSIHGIGLLDHMGEFISCVRSWYPRYSSDLNLGPD